MPKYISNPEGRLTGEYYSQSSGNDVIFLGDCEVYETFVPAVLWEKYGISSYVRGSAQQLIWQSYYILEETLKYETPKIELFLISTADVISASATEGWNGEEDPIAPPFGSKI